MRPPKRIDIGEYVNHALDNDEPISNGTYSFEYDSETELWEGVSACSVSGNHTTSLTTDQLIDYLFNTIY